MIKRMLRKTAKVLGVIAVLAVLLFGGWKLYLDKTYFRGYDATAPLNFSAR